MEVSDGDYPVDAEPLHRRQQAALKNAAYLPSLAADQPGRGADGQVGIFLHGGVPVGVAEPNAAPVNEMGVRAKCGPARKVTRGLFGRNFLRYGDLNIFSLRC